MQVSVTFRQMDPSDALRDYASRKLEHTVRKYIHAPIDAQATFSIEKFWHIAKFNLQVRGLLIKTEEKSEDMYASVDLALDKLERRLRRYKDKIRNHKPSQNRGQRFEIKVVEAQIPAPPPGLDPEEMEAAAAGAYDEDVSLPSPEEYGVVDVAVDAHEAAKGHKHPKVLRSKQVEASVMGLNEAVMQLDLVPQKFFVFTNQSTGMLNIVFERDDGNYGLLDLNKAG